MNMIKIEEIKELIVELNGQKIIVDKDIAELYGVETRDINKAVKSIFPVKLLFFDVRFPAAIFCFVDKYINYRNNFF